MIERKFLVDNNALGIIGVKRRSSGFFRAHCRVTEDVAYEARYTAKTSEVAGLSVPVTPAMLTKLVEVMATVPVGDTKLVDLYDNTGSADPMLVAAALVLNEKESESLLGDEWVIVTRDKAVRAKADEFKICVLTPEELAAEIDRNAG